MVGFSQNKIYLSMYFPKQTYNKWPDTTPPVILIYDRNTLGSNPGKHRKDYSYFGDREKGGFTHNTNGECLPGYHYLFSQDSPSGEVIHKYTKLNS